MSGPRASFILLGYNNERFVVEAMNSVFAQDYPSLEIILSDDCSSDQTFKLMSQAAEAYRGPHLVKLNQTKVNSGTLAHLYDAVEKATGELIVLGAADDISYPTRVKKLVASWRSSQAQALFSSQDLIDENGSLIARGHTYDDADLEWKDYFPRVRSIRGATSAYAKSTFLEIPPPDARILFEDTFFTLMLHLNGSNIAFVEEPLVQYRIHEGAITNADFGSLDHTGIIARERAAQTYAASVATLLETFRSRLGNHPPPEKLATDQEFYDFRSRWFEANFHERLHALISAKRPQHRRWIIARLFGPKVLASTKTALQRRRGR